MSIFLKLPTSYKDITTVAIRGMWYDSDTVICTTEKRLMTFFKGCLIKNCYVNIEVKHLEPFVTYEPKVEVHYILHGDNTVVIVKEGTSLEIIATYNNVYEMAVNDNNNSGIPQLYIRNNNGFECIDNFENKEKINNCKLQETSVVYTFCVNKLQKLKILHDVEKNKLSQKASSFISAVKQVSINRESDVELPLNVETKNSWLKLSNENIVYGFTLQNNSKLPVTNFNLILFENNKHIWSRFRYECWMIKRKESAFNFQRSCEHDFMSNNIEKSCLFLNPESSIIVASIIDNWTLKPLPYFINGLIHISNEKYERVKYISTDEIMVTSNLFLDKEFEIFVKNSVFIEDIVTLHCTKLISCYQIKCNMCLNDLKNIMVNNFKFDTKHEWFVHSSLSWLSTIMCSLDPISPLEYILKVYSNSLVFIKTFIQILSTMLPEHTSITSLDNEVATYSSLDDIILDLRELRRVFKEYLNEQIIIPRDQWNRTRFKLIST